jgi:hypothetical protein
VDDFNTPLTADVLASDPLTVIISPDKADLDIQSRHHVDQITLGVIRYNQVNARQAIQLQISLKRSLDGLVF